MYIAFKSPVKLRDHIINYNSTILSNIIFCVKRECLSAITYVNKRFD